MGTPCHDVHMLRPRTLARHSRLHLAPQDHEVLSNIVYVHSLCAALKRLQDWTSQGPKGRATCLNIGIPWAETSRVAIPQGWQFQKPQGRQFKIGNPESHDPASQIHRVT
eukprot:361697-Chlamydomonas_euryale.AAC.5